MSARPLTEKQRRFVEAYMGESRGNATDAARRAGYAGSDATLATVGNENLRKPKIREAIQARQEEDPLTLGREDLQRFWSQVILDDDEDMTHRLKASHLLGKSQAVFVDRIEGTTKVDISEALADILGPLGDPK